MLAIRAKHKKSFKNLKIDSQNHNIHEIFGVEAMDALKFRVGRNEYQWDE